jgi:hypothetical protein
MSDDPMLSSVRAVRQIKGQKKPDKPITDLAVELDGETLVVVGWRTTKDGVLRLVCERR